MGSILSVDLHERCTAPGDAGGGGPAPACGPPPWGALLRDVGPTGQGCVFRLHPPLSSDSVPRRP